MTGSVIPFPANASPVASAGRTSPLQADLAQALTAIVRAGLCLAEANVDFSALADQVDNLHHEIITRNIDLAPDRLVGLTTQATALRGAVFFGEILRRTGLAPLNTPT